MPRLPRARTSRPGGVWCSRSASGLATADDKMLGMRACRDPHLRSRTGMTSKRSAPLRRLLSWTPLTAGQLLHIVSFPLAGRSESLFVIDAGRAHPEYENAT